MLCSSLLVDAGIDRQIAEYLDAADAASLALTCVHFYDLCKRVHGSGLFQVPRHQKAPPQLPQVHFSDDHLIITGPSSPSASSTSDGSGSDDETLASTDTEMSDDAAEEPWVLKMTPDLMRRLSLLPDVSSAPNLPSLPTELHLQIFSYLDKIDSACLGLTSRSSYLLFRAIHGTKMPLNTRRVGPNSLESAWEVVGKQECKQCGIYRCELHQHIKTWMPNDLEYCAMKQNFGLRAKDGAHATCHRGKPSKPHRCGRHPLRTTSMHEGDPWNSTL